MRKIWTRGVWGVSDTFKFGKHHDEMFGDVIVDHPTYVAWCLDKIDGFELDGEALQLLEESLRGVR